MKSVRAVSYAVLLNHVDAEVGFPFYSSSSFDQSNTFFKTESIMQRLLDLPVENVVPISQRGYRIGYSSTGDQSVNVPIYLENFGRLKSKDDISQQPLKDIIKKFCLILENSTYEHHSSRFEICNPSLRSNIIESWDFWNSLRLDRLRWKTIDWDWFLDSQASIYSSDGRRFLYFEFTLPDDFPFRQKDNETFLYTAAISYDSKTEWDVGSMTRIETPQPFIIQQELLAGVRIFFEPGFRFSLRLAGSHLSSDMRLSLKPFGCHGPYDYQALRCVSPQYSKQLSIDEAIFSSRADFASERNSMADWRRAVLHLIRRTSLKQVPQNVINSLIKIRQLMKEGNNIAERRAYYKAAKEEAQKFHLCLYPSENVADAINVGVVRFSFSYKDATEFIFLIIILLLGIPVALIWSIGCATVKQNKYKNDLRRLRVLQRKEQIEDRLMRCMDLSNLEIGSDDDTDLSDR